MAPWRRPRRRACVLSLRPAPSSLLKSTVKPGVLGRPLFGRAEHAYLVVPAPSPFSPGRSTLPLHSASVTYPALATEPVRRLRLHDIWKCTSAAGQRA